MASDAKDQNDESIRSLISSVRTDAQTLFKAQSQLARTEIDEAKSDAGTTGGMFGGAAVLGVLGIVFLLVTLAYGLVALGLPEWAGFGIVTLLLLLAAGIMAAIGKKKAKGIKGPELAKLEWERTRAALSGAQPENLPVPRAGGTVASAGPRTTS